MLMAGGHEHAVRVEPAVLCWSWERFKINKEGFSTISAFCGKMMVWLVVSHCTATSTVLYSQNIVTASSFALKTSLKCLKMIEKYRFRDVKLKFSALFGLGKCSSNFPCHS